jgi:arsenate reductase-like glutaredoxin family protein
MTEELSTGKQKLSVLVNSHIGPKIQSFVDSLADDELLDLLKSFKTMNIDLMKDLTKEAEKRKIRSKQWTEDSPFDALMEQGIEDK